MTNAINIHGTVQTRINGIGSALRCVVAVGREMRRGLLHQRPGKRLDAAHPSYALAAPLASPAVSPSLNVAKDWSDSASWQRPCTGRPVEAAAAARMAAADFDLPAAAWATLVVARTASA